MKIRRTALFARWLVDLRDRTAKAKIARRLERLEDGHRGDVRAVGDGVSELRIDYGPGYRIYFTQVGDTILILPLGGDKDSQRRDIDRAKQLAKEWKND